MYDVIIAGSGITGSCLGMILAKQGLTVLIIELGKHPRFALGEALLPQSALWPFIIGEYFDIPEIQHLSHADRIVDNITHACGIKHSIGFGYHHPHQPLTASEVHQLIPPHLPFYSESHLLREEVDQYLLEQALEYGIEYMDETKIESIDFESDQVVVRTTTDEFQAQYYVDASGKSSTLVAQEGYADFNHNAQTHSRCIFTHVENLPAIDDLLDDELHQTRRLHDGTFHHMFDGGWMWIIPFDNFERSESNRCSIGLMLDPRKYPIDEALSPEEEMQEILAQFPTIQAHLANSTAIRPYVRTGRLQYKAKQAVGERHFISNNVYGFIDPLYSSGLINSFETVFYGANLLLRAFEEREAGIENPFAAEHFQSMQELLEAQWTQADLMISMAYRAMQSPKTWHAWTQFWLAQVLFHDIWIQRHCFQYFEQGDKTIFQRFLQETRPGNEAPFFAAKNDILDHFQQTLDQLDAKAISPDEAQAQMLSQLESQEWLPKHVYKWGSTEQRNVDFANPEVVQQLLGWGFTQSPEWLRENLFDFSLPPM